MIIFILFFINDNVFNTSTLTGQTPYDYGHVFKTIFQRHCATHHVYIIHYTHCHTKLRQYIILL